MACNRQQEQSYIHSAAAQDHLWY